MFTTKRITMKHLKFNTGAKSYLALTTRELGLLKRIMLIEGKKKEGHKELKAFAVTLSKALEN